MKNFLRFAAVVICFAAVSSVALAGGDKVRGAKGQGAVNQNGANSQGNQN